MKEFLFAICISGFLLLGSCSNTKPLVTDITCFREINTEIAKRLEIEIGSKYDSIKAQVKLVMEFSISDNGRADSIFFVKSNLREFDINESNLIEVLKKKDYKCLRDVYYTDQLKPESIVVIFNPELID